MADTRPVVIIGGPPTSNGDLHIGHIAGPYLGADVHRRYLRAAGREAVFASCTDDSQTYLVTSAARVGLTPPELVKQSTENIQLTFKAMGVEVDGFSPTDEGYKALVHDYVKRLYDKGKLRLRKVRLPYSESKSEFLVEGFVGGGCPTCLADSRGGFCEGCGHPIDFDALIEPYSVLDPADEVTYRETEIMVFPVSEYREQLLAYYEERGPAWRPHVLGLMRELLAGPLPDFAITYPVKWGLPAPFLQTPGQRLNAWVEGMPASMYCTEYALRRNGKPKVADDDAWLAENDARVVVFMGFDPLFTWGVVHVAELIALEGRYVLPDTLLVNEFYELENEKFSTSKGHVVWARELAAEVPRDIARFHLNLTAPEFARTNFSRAALEKVASERLVTPWNELAETLAKLTAEVGGENGSLPVSTEATERAAAMVSRFALNYELEDFSLSRAADLVVQHVERLRAATERTLKGNLDQEMLRARLGDLFLELRALIGCASPILIDLAERAAEAGRFEPRITAAAFDVTHTTAFTVPPLEFPPTSEV